MGLFYFYAQRLGIVLIEPKAITKHPLTSRKFPNRPEAEVSNHQHGAKLTQDIDRITHIYHLERRTFL
ncbi:MULTISPECIES: hypothetical protein [Cyanophyceae]|uniref:hypothetical protein n=1 Tax=Cyanophyceae TaxID=3028117 RepID=UPI00168358DE|nr:hypothetical protein [Trichocoleus sp. FACHB-40]MBD2003935.1 hypothetical protein [Trichocoleus sp. FACHB-40]